MKRFKPLFLIFSFIPILLFSQIRLPLETQTPPIGTSNAGMVEYLQKITAASDMLEMEIAGKSHQQREIPVVFCPPRKQWKSENTTVMIFAQQHGNEPSGKEALLMILHEIYLNPSHYDFSKLNLIFVPMVNPDGNEVNRRRNGNHYDLNRNHVILTEPETRALQKIFNKYLPQVTLDVHEYGFSTWLKEGYIKDFGEQFDCITNPAIPAPLKNFALNEILQPTIQATRDRGVRANRYLITKGGLTDFVRHSTTDINDGRNGFGIQLTLSFILEGFNPLSKSEQIWQRAKYQQTFIENFIAQCRQKSPQIKQLVDSIREKAKKEYPDSVVIIADYTKKSSRPLEVTLRKVSTLRDEKVTLPDYRPDPENLLVVSRPEAYIVINPRDELMELLNNQNLPYKKLDKKQKLEVEVFRITGTDTLHYETRDTIIPAGKFIRAQKEIPAGSIRIPTLNERAIQIVQIFEPRSFYGLSHYPEYRYLIEGKEFPIYREISRK
ncbi:MAG: DUF2817 domain-containing protein [Calditrichaeota bacterium]|nr:DUF2817 domain-containing protein [Calditrichota bacterium]